MQLISRVTGSGAERPSLTEKLDGQTRTVTAYEVTPTECRVLARASTVEEIPAVPDDAIIVVDIYEEEPEEEPEA